MTGSWRSSIKLEPRSLSRAVKVIILNVNSRVTTGSIQVPAGTVELNVTLRATNLIADKIESSVSTWTADLIVKNVVLTVHVCSTLPETRCS